MSRLTGSEVSSLMEAYQAVYAPQELTEEQVWEEVENWVNSLVEEGYDLSEYTWEEAYEAYFQLDEVAPLAIPAAMAAAPYVLPALGAATYAAKEFMNRRKTKSQEPVDYGQTSFSASKESERRGKEAAELNRKQNRPAQPASTPVSGRTIRGERPRIRVAATRPQGSTTSTPGGSVQQPKPPEKPPESPKTPETTPGQSSSSSAGGGGGAAKPPGFGEKLRQRMQSDTARRTAEREARRARPNPIGQAVQNKAVDLTARGMDKLATAAKNVAKLSLGAGVAGLIDQGLGGGVGGKLARDAYNLTRQSGPAYDKFMGRGKGTTPPPPRPQRGTPPKVESFYASGGIIEEKVDPIEIYNRQGNLQKVTPGKGYPITKGGKRGYVVYNTSGKPKFTEYPSQSDPTQQPPVQDKGSRRSGESLGDFSRRQSAELQKDYPTTPAPAQPPATTTPAPAQPPATTTPAPAATTQRPTQTQRPAEPKVSPSKPAQTGDRTKDLTTWASANKNMINKVGTPQQKEILSAAEKGTAIPAPRPISKDVEDIKKMQAASRERQGVKESYDAYDLVLEYLLSQGHTDTVEEAHYVMMEMDAETIGTIVEAAADQSDKQIDKGVKTTYKAQNVLDNQHQGRSKGLNKLPRGEREEKAKRMGGRLKSRRDDLFGERNKREDSKREQLKKMLGL